MGSRLFSGQHFPGLGRSLLARAHVGRCAFSIANLLGELASAVAPLASPQEPASAVAPSSASPAFLRELASAVAPVASFLQAGVLYKSLEGLIKMSHLISSCYLIMKDMYTVITYLSYLLSWSYVTYKLRNFNL